MTTTSNNNLSKNNKTDELISSKNQLSINDEKEKDYLSSKKYIKKLHVKPYKINGNINDALNRKKAKYGKCFEREKNKEKFKEKRIGKKKN